MKNKTITIMSLFLIAFLAVGAALQLFASFGSGVMFSPGGSDPMWFNRTISVLFIAAMGVIGYLVIRRNI